MKNRNTVDEPLQLDVVLLIQDKCSLTQILNANVVTAVNNRACDMIISDGLHIWDLTQTAAHAARLITVPWGVIQSPVNDPKSLVQFSVPWRM